MKVLVAGGAGYIGSTTCSALLDNGHVPIILDSLVTGREAFVRDRIFYKGDIADARLVSRIISEHPDIFCAMHFAALIVVPDSVSDPYGYYRENVAKSLEFYKCLVDNGIERVLFSSSASIYSDVPDFMATESTPLYPRSPYARTKRIMEEILEDFAVAYGMKGIALRYFNPIGADPKMRTGMPLALPSHVLGKLISAANGKEPEFVVTGTGWPTRDGTGIRDYVHVWDLALAHVKAVERFDSALEEAGSVNNIEAGSSSNIDVASGENAEAGREARGGFLAINLGSGSGVTVREIVAAFENVYGIEVPKREAPPRDGDVAGAYASAELAKRLLFWEAELSIEDGIRDALAWDRVRGGVLGEKPIM